MKSDKQRVKPLEGLVLNYHYAAHSMLNIVLEETGLKLTDIIYAAGYLDAEGCFRHSNTPRVSISNTYPYTLVRFQELFGGSFRDKKEKRKNRRNTYEWSCTGENARNCIRVVYPFLQEKKRQAEILLQLTEFPKKSARRAALLKELTAQKRIDYHLKNTEVNAWTRKQNEHC